MRSKRGFLAAAVFLFALPLGVLFQALLGVDAETVFHFALATGSALLCLSVPDLKTPRWIALAGFVSTGGLAVIFLLQGIGQIAHNPSLTWLAFNVLGQRPESLLVDLMLLWFMALLLTNSAGKTRIFGLVVVSAAIGVKIYSYVLETQGTSLDAEAPALKILLLLPFLWLLFECWKSDVHQL